MTLASAPSPTKMPLQLLILSLLLLARPSSSASQFAKVASSSAFLNNNGNNITTQKRHQIRYAAATAAFSQRRNDNLVRCFSNERKRENNVIISSQIPKIIGGGPTSTSSAAIIQVRRNDNKKSTKLFASSTTDKNDTPSSNDPNNKKYNIKKSVTTVLSITTLALLILNRQYLPTPSQIRTSLISSLDYLASLGTPGLIIYALSLALWEMTMGITTPVETAAGMAFGIQNGIIASALGKISGAIASYSLGKYILSSKVHKALKDNEMLGLIEDDVKCHPLRTALIWRFSPLPEFVKNYGLSILEPLRTRTFVAAVMLHGLPFTCLWTCLGNETGLLIRGVVDGPSRTLKVLVSGVSWFGFLVSPTLVGMWVKGLRDKQIEKHKKEEEDYLIDDASF